MITPEAGGDVAVVHIRIEYGYDARGRIEHITQYGGGHWGVDAGPDPIFETRGSYGPDGTMRIERRDYSTDTPNDRLEVNGVTVMLSRFLEEHSPQCAAIAAEIGRPPRDRCLFDPVNELR